jgi:hypothetical protein
VACGAIDLGRNGNCADLIPGRLLLGSGIAQSWFEIPADAPAPPAVAVSMDIEEFPVRPGSVGASDNDVTPGPTTRDLDGDIVLVEAIGQPRPPGMAAFSPAPTHRPGEEARRRRGLFERR